MNENACSMYLEHRALHRNTYFTTLDENGGNSEDARIISDPSWELAVYRESLRDKRVLSMRVSWRLWLRLALIVVAIVLIWLRIASGRHAKAPATKPITDLAATSPLNQPGGGAVPAEAYDVYSGLYQAPTQEPLAFAENSVTDIPQLDGSCLKPSTAEEHEMADAFVAANRQSHRWEQKFSIPQGYRLLAHGETVQAQTCLASHGRDATACEGFKQIRHVRFLGVPGFDRTHIRALVSVIKNCGGFCGSGGIFAVEKTGGTWQRSATTDFTRDCSWMY
jgi:hypothetical protein